MWVNVDSGRLFVEQSGKGSPLVLVHGWPLDHRVFEPQLRYLSRHFRVVTFDRRGFGRSEAPAKLSQELDDIDRILSALSLDRVHLLGMSQGGRIALRYAVTRPRTLRSLILQGAVVDGLEIADADLERIPLEDYAQLLRAGRVDIVREHWMDHPMMTIDDRYPAARQLVSEIISTYTGTDLVGYNASHYAFPLDIADGLSRLPVPILLLTGAYETATRRAHARKLLELVPDIKEIVFEHSGHMCNLTEPELYNLCVEKFCKEVDTNAAVLGSSALD
jgi:pimeloyl-ACP methyl ester carboxylesterase